MLAYKRSQTESLSPIDSVSLCLFCYTILSVCISLLAVLRSELLSAKRDHQSSTSLTEDILQFKTISTRVTFADFTLLKAERLQMYQIQTAIYTYIR